MEHFLQLPPEIAALVFARVPSQSLSFLGATCKALHSFVEPYLYSSIVVGKYSNLQCLVTAIDEKLVRVAYVRSIHVVSLYPLGRIRLKHHGRDGSDADDSTPLKDSESSQLTRLLKHSFPKLKRVILEGEIRCSDPSRRNALVDGLFNQPSLEDVIISVARDISASRDIGELFRLSQHPRLERFCLQGGDELFDAGGLLWGARIVKPRGSTPFDLRLFDYTHEDAHGLRTVVSLMEPLGIFCYTRGLFTHKRPIREKRSDFQSMLRPSAQTLKTLVFHNPDIWRQINLGFGSSYDDDDDTTLDLSTMGAITTLVMDVHFFGKDDDTFDVIEAGKRLPPNLTTLGLATVDEWNRGTSNMIDHGAINFVAKLLPKLHEAAPHLKSVTVYFHTNYIFSHEERETLKKWRDRLLESRPVPGIELAYTTFPSFQDFAQHQWDAWPRNLVLPDPTTFDNIIDTVKEYGMTHRIIVQEGYDI